MSKKTLPSKGGQYRREQDGAVVPAGQAPGKPQPAQPAQPAKATSQKSKE